MATAKTRTLLPLDRFAAILNIHPLHFNQVYLSGLAAQIDDSSARTCDVPILQYSWATAGKLGREDIAIAIAEAEQMMIARLGFLPAPGWIVDEQRSLPRPRNPDFIAATDLDIRGYFKTVQASQGHLISGGKMAKTLIEADSVVTYTDTDSDGYFETATITFNTTVTDTNEIAVYYPGESGSEEWEIRPLASVSITGGVATVVFKREQCVIRALLESMFPRGVSGTDNPSFLVEVDVYRKYNDPSIQSEFIWDTIGGTRCDCDGSSSCATCGYGVQNGCMVIRNPRLGIVSPQPGTWDSATGEFLSAQYEQCRTPDRVNLNLYGGFRNLALARPNVTMDPRFERAITYLALTFLNRPLCACEPITQSIQRWRDDLSLSESVAGRASSFRLDAGMLRNPFGTTRGAIAAWETVVMNQLGQGVTP